MTTTQPDIDLLSVASPRDSHLLGRLKEFLEAHRDKASLTAPDGTTAELPDEVFQVIARTVDAMSQGSAVAISAVGTRLTTSQAAEVLGVSRPTLIKMLDEGKIPYEQLNVHRSVNLVDVLAFQDRRRAETRRILDGMTRQSEADGLYSDGFSHDDIAAALDQVRHHGQ
ncbi:MAG: helix-turn-helix domain-containing protein [Bifidobacteriaceae bacterium]|jgi:excisionase family DNA binding protein|nr:helix-turn-helix domain-containing protein [Bifidobacteriaceae bacterium]